MRYFFLFLTIALLFSLNIQIAAAYHRPSASPYAGFGSGSIRNGNFIFHQTPNQIGSGIYNARRFGVETGFNPFYARSTPASFRNYNTIRSHIFRRDQLSDTIYRNPELLIPRYSINPQRNLRGFDIGFFTMWHAPNAATGRIRTSVTCNLC